MGRYRGLFKECEIKSVVQNVLKKWHFSSEFLYMVLFRVSIKSRTSKKYLHKKGENLNQQVPKEEWISV